MQSHTYFVPLSFLLFRIEYLMKLAKNLLLIERWAMRLNNLFSMPLSCAHRPQTNSRHFSAKIRKVEGTYNVMSVLSTERFQS